MNAIDKYLEILIERKGSDLHLSAGIPPKIRVHGQLECIADAPLGVDEITNIMEECCTPEKWQTYLETNDLDFGYQFGDNARFRVNYLRNNYGPACVMRIIPTNIKSIDDLGLPKILYDIAKIERGLVLVTGPTGSGKSTTLAAIIDDINSKSSRHIITIEDPIEFVHKNKKSIIVQREVGTNATTFNSALRGAMRADPDIVLVGELRDQETISLALTCAAMGMLVFSTLHTSSAPKTVDRIIDTFPAEEQNQIRSLLSQTLQAVVSQLLCRTASGKGRVGSFEILLRTDALAAIIRDGEVKGIRNIIEQSSGIGMCTMDQSLRQLLKNNKITPLEAFMKASDKAEFESMLSEEDRKFLHGGE